MLLPVHSHSFKDTLDVFIIQRLLCFFYSSEFFCILKLLWLSHWAFRSAWHNGTSWLGYSKTCHAQLLLKAFSKLRREAILGHDQQPLPTIPDMEVSRTASLSYFWAWNVLERMDVLHVFRNSSSGAQQHHGVDVPWDAINTDSG